jgi:hypothetical protein
MEAILQEWEARTPEKNPNLEQQDRRGNAACVKDTDLEEQVLIR